MKPIIIRDYTDTETVNKINAWIDEVQKRSKVRTISAYDIIDTCKDLDKLFEIVPKKHRDGITSEVDPNAQTFPGAYRRKGIPESTQFRLMYKNGTWRLTDVCRKRCNGETYAVRNTLPEEAKDFIVLTYETRTRI